MKQIALLILLAVALSAPASARTDDSMNTTLITAAQRGDHDTIAKALQTSDFDVNISDSQGRNLLLIATENRQTELARLLVEHGADVNQQDNKQDSAFLYAGASGQTELLKLYIQHGARFDRYNRYGGTALIPACERGHIDTVKLLADTEGFPINHVNKLGWTALMEAVILGDGSDAYQQIVRLLLAHGADATIPDHDGITALQHARAKGFDRLAAILDAAP